jgi:hypothetical protein
MCCMNSPRQPARGGPPARGLDECPTTPGRKKPASELDGSLGKTWATEREHEILKAN